MLQIAIWGIAAMLVIKGLDVLHRDTVAAKNGRGDPAFAWIICLLAIGCAIAICYVANEQVKATSRPFSGLSSPSVDSSSSDVNVTIEDAQKAIDAASK